VFTGCGTEADNAAVTGVIRRRGGVAVCPAAEHHAVLHCVEHVGGRVVAVNSHGSVDLVALEASLDDDVTCVSVMAVNNEVGTITDLAAVASVVRRLAPRALLHTDAVQAASWIDLREVWPHVDAMSLSAHKFGGPKGVGILVVRQGVVFEPVILGGGQERDRRSGTHNVAGIVSCAEALRLTDLERDRECARIQSLRERLTARLCAVDAVTRTVPDSVSVPGVAHFCIAGVESETLLYLLDEGEVCASAASACASGALETSHVLAAMGVDPALSAGALRLSLGHDTTEAHIDRAADVIIDAITRIRDMNRQMEARRNATGTSPGTSP